MRKQVIVTTTINAPTEAIRRFDALDNWHLIVVGDLKTPGDFHLENGTYLPPEQQHALDPALSDLIGWNCIQRRNFGFLEAWRLGADVVATVDDDNVPLDGWGENVWVGSSVTATVFRSDLPAFDPIGATDYPNLWHRGFPLQLIPGRRYDDARSEHVHVDVQADFWNGDPDIDAVCRMQFAPQCRFDPARFPIAADAISPFDSQNTFIAREWLPEYFMFPHVGRMDDIWASYHLQARGARVVYGPPSVFQERNEHDPVVDLRREYLGYEHNLEMLRALRGDPDAVLTFLPPPALAAFNRYRSLF